jgi:NADPH:quinone reductase-like Zn-dependent oxidoreductase
MNRTMKAVRIHSFGGPETLVIDEVPRPEPGPGEVLVKVHAAGVNPVDWKIRQGYFESFAPHQLPLTLGWDLSGTVEETGPGVNEWKVGDAVYAMADASRNGSDAEYIVIDADLLAAKPRSLDHARAAAVPLAALTAWHALFEYGNLKAGQKVLIHGAAGGVGGFAVQMAAHKGALVAGTGSARNRSLILESGASNFIDYAATPFEKAVSDVDMVLDTVGGETHARSYAVLRKGGLLLSTSTMPDPVKAEEHGVRAKYVQNRPDAKALKEIAEWIDKGYLRVMAESLPLEQARKAHELSQGGHVRGKLVLRIA